MTLRSSTTEAPVRPKSSTAAWPHEVIRPMLGAAPREAAPAVSRPQPDLGRAQSAEPGRRGRAVPATLTHTLSANMGDQGLPCHFSTATAGRYAAREQSCAAALLPNTLSTKVGCLIVPGSVTPCPSGRTRRPVSDLGGTEENTNKLLQQYLPKGTNLSTFSQDDLDAIAAKGNNRPRTCLGPRTPADSRGGRGATRPPQPGYRPPATPERIPRLPPARSAGLHPPSAGRPVPDSVEETSVAAEGDRVRVQGGTGTGVRWSPAVPVSGSGERGPGGPGEDLVASAERSYVIARQSR